MSIIDIKPGADLEKRARGWYVSRATSLFILATQGLMAGGCAVVDNFSTRAVEYNQNYADARTATILTNVMRAAYAEPLQFSELTGVNGQGTLDLSTGSTLPFPFRGGLGAVLPQQFIGASPNAKGTLSSSFNVANLASQEFYQGLQEPVSLQLIYSYLASGSSPHVVLALMVSQIEVNYNGRIYTARNDPDDKNEFLNFYSAMNQLIRAGIYAERTGDTTAVSPTLTSYEAKSPQVLAAIINSSGPDAPSLEQANGGFRLVKKRSETRPCFRSPLKPSRLALIYEDRKIVREWELRLNRGDFCGATAAEIKLTNLGPNLKMQPRSLEEMFHYLGKIARAQLGLSNESKQQFLIERSRIAPFELFKVTEGHTAGNTISTRYRSKTYSISLDPSGDFDGSSRVLQLINDLMALRSSSKTLSSPAVITVLGP